MIGVTVPFWLLLATLGAAACKRNRASLALLAWPQPLLRRACCRRSGSGGRSRVADVSYLASRQAFVQQRRADALRLSMGARGLNPTSVKYARGVAEVTQVEAELAVARQAPPEVVSAAYEAAQAEIEWVIMQSPADYPARAWLAALQALVGTNMKDDRLMTKREPPRARHRKLDRQHSEVEGLARGDLSAGAISGAANVPRLP